MSTRRLTVLWQRWADRPYDSARVNILEDEVQRVAGELGTSGSQLRIAVTERVMAGASVEEAIEAVVG